MNPASRFFIGLAWGLGFSSIFWAAVAFADPAPTVTLTQDELLRVIDAQVATYAANAANARATEANKKINDAFKPPAKPETNPETP